VVPRPWTRVGVAIGEPRRIPRELAADRLEAERARLQTTLEELEIEARAAVGARAATGVGIGGAEGFHGKKIL
jgi:hypothetical protein